MRGNMQINFQTGDVAETGKQYTEKPQAGQHVRKSHAEKAGQNGKARRTGAYQVDFSSGVGQNFNVPGKEKGKSFSALQQEAGNIDVDVMQNYMTLMSNILSEEDYKELSEEGFHFQNIDPEQAVTIVDKIKAELARSGQVIVGYTDDLDMETLAAAVGSEALARSVAGEFAQSNLPLTQENVEKIGQAWDMASELNAPTQGTYQYMVDNGMEPEIYDFYLAESSGAQTIEQGTAQNAGGYYAEEIQGYYTQNASPNATRFAGKEVKGGQQKPEAEEQGLQKQIDQVIDKAGLEGNKENRERAYWLLEKGLPLTAENLKRLNELHQVTFPVTEEVFAKAAAAAIAEGKNPIHANLAHSRNIYEQAAEMDIYYHSEEIWNELGGDITARRQLEEIRLRMTAEVNVKLLKSGFSIDTAPMEQLIDALKQAEKQVAESYFPEDAQAVEKYQLYQNTNQTVRELPDMPAQMLGVYSRREESFTLAEFHAEGRTLQETYQRASESYEALMTAPRKDLGDNIRKAFSNVDAIIEELGVRPVEESRRAVRILGYNSMEITPENIERVMAADRQVRDVVNKMTPASVLKMIRDGVNPLEQSFDELQEYFDSNEESYEESAESYSRFLYGLERQKEITAQERDAYIGVYRMIHQIEKSDGAAIGAVINSQAELQFANLLSAVRSSKFKHMDVKVEDAFGLSLEIVRKGETIDSQISKAFVRDVKEIMTEVSYSKEAQEQYLAQELEQVREAALTDTEAAALLQRGEVTPDAGSLLAAQALLQPDNNLFAAGPFKKTPDAALEEGNAELAQTAEELLDGLSDKEVFRENYREFVDDLKGQLEEASVNQADTFLDVRSLQMVHKQLSIAGKLSASEEYVIPMYIGERLAKVRLTMERGSGEKGGVHISVALSGEEQIEAHFAVKAAKGESGGKRTLQGFLAGNTESEVTKLKRTADIFSDYISEGRENLQNVGVETLPIIRREVNAANVLPKSPKGNIIGTEANDTMTDGSDNLELYRIAKVFLQAVREEEVVYENQL
ncbi:MAG: DUF6240 domain-containing protein [Lachnoclostridium sp.]|nr:DUF6240 domain-containing protein [Lachnospira sp.]MCM1247993.1 DUF6240 domain-containing protein [Lachnoclostridium sp.]